jgi:hypothetical protein
MGKCECGAEIDDKYIYCVNCVKKKQQANKEVGAVRETPAGASGDLADLLSKINSNLYALRTIEEYKLGIDYRAELKTNAETKRLEVIKKTKARK